MDDRAALILALLRERFGPDARHRPSTAPSTDDPQPDDDEPEPDEEGGKPR